MENEKKGREAGPWLEAWKDSLANAQAFTECVRTADLRGDGDYRLVIADRNQRLKVYRGSSLVSNSALLETPTAVATFYPDLSKPQVPSVAVAAGSVIYIYRNLRPYYKFQVPDLPVAAEEKKAWEEFRDKSNIEALIGHLLEARNNRVQLTPTSAYLIALEDREEQFKFANKTPSTTIRHETAVTCVQTLNKTMEDARAVSGLVVGTEAKQVLVIDSSGAAILKKIDLPSVPVFMRVQGMYEVDYCIIVACRNGHIYTIKKGKLLGNAIELDSHACAMDIIDKTIVVACIDSSINCFSMKGKKHYSLYMPASISALSCFRGSMQRSDTYCMIVALTNGEVRLYNKKQLIHTLHTNDVVTAVRLSPFAREDEVLTLVYKSGGVQTFFLKRKADLDVTSTAAGPPPEQDEPIRWQKSRLAEEQSIREKDQAVSMHRIFQRELCKLRLATVRSYVKVLTDNVGPLSNARGSSLRINAEVFGLGPLFKLKLTIKNTSQKAVVNVPITFAFNHDIYMMPQSLIMVPVLVPGVAHEHLVEVRCIDATGAADAIKVFVCNTKSSVPALCAIVNMPTSEVNVE